MSKRYFLLLTLALLFLPGRASAQSFPVFVSVIDAGQIVKVQTGTATIFHTFTGFGTVRPEDMVFGPDGRLYVCDSLGSRIFRVNINPDGSTGDAVIIANLSGVPEGTTRPEGPSFNGDDLFFNTRAGGHTGVWKIPGVAAVDSAPFPEPVNLIPSISVGAFPFGEGTAFDPQGRFIIVDRAGDRILRASAPFTSFSVIIENSVPEDPLFIARGVAVNGAGEIFVSNALSFNIVRCVESAGTFTCSEFVSFVSTSPSLSEVPGFMEFDAAGNLLVVTFEFFNPLNNRKARLREVDPLGNTNVLASFDENLPGLGTTFLGEVIGLALPPTEVSKVAEFRDDQKTNTYDFDDLKFRLTLDVNENKQFFVKITAREELPQNVIDRLDPNVFPPETDCIRIPGRDGKCVFFVAEGASGLDGTPGLLPVPQEDFSGAIEVHIKYFESPGSPAANPRMAHAFGEIPGADFTEDMTTFFSPTQDPNDPDPTLRGRTTDWSEFAGLDVALLEEAIFSGFGQPLGEGGITIKAGRTLPVKFSLTDSLGAPIIDAVARISVEKIEIADGDGGVLVDFAEPTGGANEGNLFRFDPETGQYVFNFGTKGLTSGVEWKLTVTINKISSRNSPSVNFFTK